MRARSVHLNVNQIEINHFLTDVGQKFLGDHLVKQVGVYLTVYLVHVSTLVILDISQRFSIARNSVQSDTTIEVSTRPRNRAQTHYFFHALATARDTVVSSYPQVASTFGVCASRTTFRRYPPNRLANPVLRARNGNFRLLSTRNRGDYVTHYYVITHSSLLSTSFAFRQGT